MARARASGLRCFFFFFPFLSYFFPFFSFFLAGRDPGASLIGKKPTRHSPEPQRRSHEKKKKKVPKKTKIKRKPESTSAAQSPDAIRPPAPALIPTTAKSAREVPTATATAQRRKCPAGPSKASASRLARPAAAPPAGRAALSRLHLLVGFCSPAAAGALGAMPGTPRKRAHREAARAPEAAAQFPRKRFYRQRAHANPFSDHALL